MSRSNYWRGKKVLVTGGSGFVGSHLVKQLLAYQAEVYTLCRHKITHHPILSTAEISQIKRQIIGQISQLKTVQTTFKAVNPEICFHLAAQPLVEKGEEQPDITFAVNVMGTTHVLEATKAYKTKCVVVASTAHVYGLNQTPLLEKFTPQPSRPYETSKACADLIAQTYASYYHLPVFIARLSNIYGPGDMNTRLVSRTISLLSQNKAPIVYNEQVTRDYIYIDDAIEAYLTLAEQSQKLHKQKNHTIYNFGSGHKYQTGQIVKRITSLMHKSHLQPIDVHSERSDEIVDQSISVLKAKKELSWTAQTSLKTGLTQTINWYLTHNLSQS